MLFFTYCKLYFLHKKVRFQEGLFKIFNKNFVYIDSASFISMYKSIFINKSYKFKTAKHNPLIIDCGANIGLSVLYFKKLYPDSIVEAFEPDKKIFEILKSNCNNFNLDNVSLINKGIWTKDGETNFLSDGADGGKIILNNNRKSLDKIKVIRLKNLLAKRKEIDLLKIDIEGAETDVLTDCRKNLSNVKLLFVEYHSSIGQKQNLDKLLKILKEANFRYHINNITVSSKNPFLKQVANGGFDLQLDIYAYRK